MRKPTADAVRTELTTHETTPTAAAAALIRWRETQRRRRRSRRTVRKLIVDAHELAPHNTDATARTTAASAQGAAEQSQADIDAHKSTPHNTHATARDASADAQSAIDDHERSPHNTDGAARTAAAAAQDRADNAFVLADEKVDASGAAAAAREVTADWAEDDKSRPDPSSEIGKCRRSAPRHSECFGWPLARLAGRNASGMVAAGRLYRFRFRPAIAADRWKYYRHER